MARPTLHDKAARLLTAGRLRLLEVRPGELVRAICHGDHGRYRLGWWRGRWGCSCPAGQYRRPCARLTALRLVVNEPGEAPSVPGQPPTPPIGGNRMTNTLAPPSTDLAPAQRAVVSETISLFEPELFVQYQFPLPDGGARFWHAWTAGGAPLGDRADAAALVRGLDLADYIDLTYPHLEEAGHGRIEIVAYKLRPIHAAILAGQRATPRTREAVACLLTNVTGRAWTTADHLAGWFGVGPGQVGRSWRA